MSTPPDRWTLLALASTHHSHMPLERLPHALARALVDASAKDPIMGIVNAAADELEALAPTVSTSVAARLKNIAWRLEAAVALLEWTDEHAPGAEGAGRGQP